MDDIDRRRLLAGTGAIALTGLAAGCKIEKETVASPSSTPTKAPATKPAGKTLGKTADVPVGGGKIFTDEGVVVTQPAQGQFKAYSVLCPHRGCRVNEIAAGHIKCPCHGSEFSVKDGSVVKGPATKPLPDAHVTVQGDDILLKS